MAVEIEIGTLADALKFDKHFAAVKPRDGKMLAIPTDRIGKPLDGELKGFVLIERMRESDTLPLAVVGPGSLSVGHIANGYKPVAVEVVFLSFARMRTH